MITLVITLSVSPCGVCLKSWCQITAHNSAQQSSQNFQGNAVSNTPHHPHTTHNRMGNGYLPTRALNRGGHSSDKPAEKTSITIVRLTPLTSGDTGDTVRLRLPGEKTWSLCTGLVGPRSYKVQCHEYRRNEYRRNRRQVIQTEEPREIELPEAIVQEEHPSSEQGPAAPQLETNIPKPVRKSGRNRKSPDWFMNYVPA